MADPQPIVYEYLDSGGAPAYEKLRVTVRDGKKSFRFRRPDGRGGFEWGLGDAQRHLYRLPDLVDADRDAPVFYVEGEKDVDSLRALGFVATTAGGATDWRGEFSVWLEGRDAIVLPDNDEPGRKLAERVAADLVKVARSVRVVELPGLAEHGDITDWLEAGGSAEALLELVDAAPPREAPEDPDEDDTGGRGERKSQGTQLVDLAIEAGLEPWRSPADDTYVRLDGAHLALRDSRVKRWLRGLWFASGGGALREQSLSEAIGTIEGIAARTETAYPVYRRVAGDERAIYIHLGHKEPVIEVDADDWRVIEDPPVRFAASASTLPLPMPVRGGSLDELRDLHPALTDDSIFALIVSFMVGALRPWGSFAFLSLVGEQGSAKSSLARLILWCLDLTQAGLRSPPRDARDLAAAVRSSRIIALDNVSRIQPWLSDALCIASTGGSFATRTLFSDADEHLVFAHQPIILTSIDDVVAIGDLRQRTLVARIPPMQDRARLTDREVAERVEAARPRILGALLDLLSRGLRRLGGSEGADLRRRGAQLHRLADHAAWALACAPVSAELIEAVHLNQRTEAASELLSDAMGEALLALGRKGWSGTMADLLAELEESIPSDQRGKGGGKGGGKSKADQDWPESARGMGSALRRRAPALRQAGVDVVEGPGYGPRRDRRGVTLAPSSGATSGTSATSGGPEISHEPAPDVADVRANVRPTSGQRPAENGNGYAGSDVPDVADVAPGHVAGWERDQDTGQLFRSCCGSTGLCLCRPDDEAEVAL